MRNRLTINTDTFYAGIASLSQYFTGKYIMLMSGPFHSFIHYKNPPLKI